ncbi:MAG: enoyl-CoA hydratase/isomerase family protein [Phaeodactylibacter xiamenensis]|uniref:Enoyl-CoA hydratase n=1 Tax=Phaeodactylibacter xiamenensis TaxID=1524460 RepID=A0A098S6W9_9BACT|nr:enoyl-CoA hydratase/isomerase family protein [Phaeodactylibacter xiamenensis]KGE86847.1 enoyl-CoA hydratase [Phaeodactylibacter xiamenensis]MCR9053007.1 enoyl-CoA hydratase/isomerase family protein [bacterium]
MTDKTKLGSVSMEVDEKGIARLTFEHPASNSLPGRLLAQLADTITAAGADPSVKVIILQSGGDRAFCGGASFDELIAIKDLDTGKRFFMGFANVINAMRKCPKFIIGRIQGKAVGGGVGLCAATDYCIASQWASVKLSELAIGIGPFVVGPAVERKVGKSAMTQLAINASEWRTAQWAKDKGLFADVFETVEQLDAYVSHLAERLSDYSPEAMRQLKAVFWEEAQDWDTLLEARAERSGELVLSDFTVNAINAFKQKA